jgi:hypothetical protein
VNYKSHTLYLKPKNTRLCTFLPSLPFNSFVAKGQTGTGASSGEMRNKSRPTIFTAPNAAIVDDLAKDFPEVFKVYAGVSVASIKTFLLSEEPGLKIVTTPDGIAKIIEAAKDFLPELFAKWFIVFDEQHTYVTEHYRDKMLDALDYFFEFKNKCMVSATPFHLSDPRMSQLHFHEVIITEPLGTVNLIEAKSINATLKQFIEQAKVDGIRLFIFYNSVSAIKSLIVACDLSIDDCNVFCSKSSGGKNETTLGQYKNLIQSIDSIEDFKLVNFLTTAAFEGWNLKLFNAPKMIFATDVQEFKKHTLISIDKGVQAFGRLRWSEDKGVPTPELYHVYNHRNIKAYKSLSELSAQVQFDAKQTVSKLQTSLQESIANAERVKDYCKNPQVDFNINTTMIDRLVKRMHTDEVYNHKDYVVQEWKDNNFNVKLYCSNYKWTSKRQEKRISASDKFKLDLNEIIAADQEPDQYIIGESIRERLQRTNLLVIKANDLLTIQEMEELKYNVKKIAEAVILKEDKTTKIKLIELITREFYRGKRYTKDYIKTTLQGLYAKLDIYSKPGIIKNATATHIKTFFDVQECKIKGNDGVFRNGFEIIRPTFMQLTKGDTDFLKS